MNLPLPPEFYTPEFWRACAEDWRGPVNEITASGICFQASERLSRERDYYWKVNTFMAQYAPEHVRAKNDYFWPATAKSRPLRAELCERIAADMAKLAQSESGRSPAPS